MGRSQPARRIVVALALIPCLLAPLAAGASQRRVGAWQDVPRHYWAHAAIDFVGARHPWMRDYGATHFHPDNLETRRYLAHAMVMAFAPNERENRKITFNDLAQTDPFYPYANIAVKLHWMTKVHGNFLPEKPVTTTELHIALVSALGLGRVAAGFNHIHTTNGYHFSHPRHVGGLEVGMLLGLRYNHANESLDVGPDTKLPRSEVALSLWRAYITKTQQQWRITSLQGYRNVALPPLSPAMKKVVQFGLRYIGYPYVYAGDWFRPTALGYCCGQQAVGGFDCSGLTWWLMKAPSGGWDNTRVRGYEGWPLPQRSSQEMASVGTKIRFRGLKPGDLMFYDDGSGHGIDHVDTYVGSGYALDSSDGVGGVTLLRVDSGWYRQHFVHGRRIIPRLQQ